MESRLTSWMTKGDTGGHEVYASFTQRIIARALLEALLLQVKSTSVFIFVNSFKQGKNGTID